MIRRAYTALGLGLTPAIHVWLKRRVARGKEDASRLGERFGHASQPRPAGTLIWLHAASVGETQSVLTLVRAILAMDENLYIMLTTGTVTSAALVARSQVPRLIHQFVPVDTPPAVSRFLNHWKPDLALWVESEFWPQLMWQTHERAIPMVLLNARFSHRSAQGWKRFPETIQSLLACFTAIYAGTRDDAARLSALGAQHVYTVGNLKYDAEPLPVDHFLTNDLVRGTRGRHVWVAASTHANEEQQIGEVHRALATEFPDVFTILIPRHAARGDAIAEDLRTRGLAVAQRSKNDEISADTGIYLADTMGELGSFFRLSPIVFLGGSLIRHGGHNPLEPARMHCAIITGPHIHNFASIFDHFLAADAVVVAANKSELSRTVKRLFMDDAAREAMAENAAAVVEQARGASTIILAHIATLLKARAA